MDDFDCRYYLFSDNICLTVDPHHNSSMTVDFFYTISELFKRFSELGYFLRGGIDYGLMLNEKRIAMGTPLAKAYYIESNIAIYPRVVFSDRLIKFLNDWEFSDSELFNIQNFQSTSSEITYLNPFYSILKTDEKVEFFDSYKGSILNQLGLTQGIESVKIKYEWLARDYNKYIDNYIANVEYLEQDTFLTEAEKEEIKNLKIKL